WCNAQGVSLPGCSRRLDSGGAGPWANENCSQPSSRRTTSGRRDGLAGAKRPRSHLQASQGHVWHRDGCLRVHAQDTARRSRRVRTESAASVARCSCARTPRCMHERREHAAARRGEIAIRAALGAKRARMLRQLTTEGLLLAMLGAMAGLALAASVLKMMQLLAPPGALPQTGDIGLDGRVVTFALAVGILAAVVSSLFPALRTSSVSITHDLVTRG